MERLIILLSTIFFQIKPSDKMQVHFLWKGVLSTPTTAGQTWPPVVGRPYSRIEMKPNDDVVELAACGNLNNGAMNRLSTLPMSLCMRICSFMLAVVAGHTETTSANGVDMDGRGSRWQIH